MSSPSQPKAPDYAEANREGIYTDIETLPIRRLIEQAAAQGKSIQYMDPRTGEMTTADFTGMGDDAATQAYVDVLLRANGDIQRQQLALREELGEKNAEQAAKEVAASDPLAYETRQEVTGKILGDLQGGVDTIDGNQNLYDVATRLQGDNSSYNALAGVLDQVLAEYQLGGQLDAQTQRQLTDSVRSGQAARGNYLGDAAAVLEAGTMGQAAEARKQQRLGNLLGVQGQVFGQGTTLDQQALQAAQVAATEERTARNETYGREQQQLANASAIVLGQPITNQFGSLAAAQQGAVGFTGAPVQQGTNINANAGQNAANFLQANWQTQMQNQQENPWMGLLGSAVGGATGALTSMI
ncbi:hypothetical protein OpiT1DRAFT_05307 [Opitutaceae bacterium TAV1]|nr:hypothetical protein OpiT1DRAFT_05307 [Opitutaceae bacterium TAV1]